MWKNRIIYKNKTNGGMNMNKLSIFRILNNSINIMGRTIKFKVIASVVLGTIIGVGGVSTAAVVVHNHSLSSLNSSNAVSNSIAKKSVETENKAINQAVNNTAETNTTSNQTQTSSTQTADAKAKAAHQELLDQAKAAAGDRLSEIQSELKSLGYAIDSPGTMGDATYCSIITFQREHGLKDDGMAGDITYNKLNSIVHPVTSNSNSGSSSSAASSQTSTSKSPTTSSSKPSVSSSNTSSASSSSTSTASSTSGNRASGLDYNKMNQLNAGEIAQWEAGFINGADPKTQAMVQSAINIAMGGQPVDAIKTPWHLSGTNPNSTEVVYKSSAVNLVHHEAANYYTRFPSGRGFFYAVIYWNSSENDYDTYYVTMNMF
jgi:peptidoglycan hydrolase-like protein with peptidoglycan-binding domain